MTGSAYLVVSAGSFALMAALVHAVRPGLDVSLVIWSRLFVSLVASWWALRRQGVSVWGNRPRTLMLRGLIGAGALSCYFLSLRVLPLAQAATIQNSSPLLVAAFAWLALGERSERRVWWAIVLGIVGVAVTGELWKATRVDPWGLGAAVVGAILAAAAYVTVRELTKTEPPLRIVLFFPVVALPLTTPWALQHVDSLRASDVWILLAIGLTTQLGQVTMTHGMATVPAGRAASFAFLQIPITMVLGMLAGEWPTSGVLAGAAIILAGQALLHAPAWRATMKARRRYQQGAGEQE